MSDTGPGMDEVTLRRATEPFFTTKGIGKGTGLGLSMVQGLTEQSGGRFILKSQVGEGTTAELWLPAAKGGVSALNEEQRTDEDANTADDALVILTVDDDGLVLTRTRTHERAAIA
jgi:hypothetical protein